ncbi:hypothetical protein F0562_010456 [Nyssa sinensis]|uniref:Uncharacterized protein n=1 Tax=Nyssa sinensis TaxID=561372 RepID=A0A5J4ZZ78_9ASTE|nr:hypothetical protein F0562_010456 [Nyssa sinensis]
MRTNLIETAVVWLGIRPLIWQLNGAVELFIAISLHFLELDLRPRVHGDGSDEADMDTKATMLTARRERWSDPWGPSGKFGGLCIGFATMETSVVSEDPRPRIFAP